MAVAEDHQLLEVEEAVGEEVLEGVQPRLEGQQVDLAEAARAVRVQGVAGETRFAERTAS